MNLTILFAVGFLFLKTGEKFATQETAGPTVATLTSRLGFEARVMNDPAKAIDYVTKSKPAAGIVTPGFYLTYGKALGMEPVLEVKREKVAAERYVLVAKQADGIKTVATPLAPEQVYVMSVVLQDKFGDELRLQSVLDVEGAVFDMADGVKNAADAVLMEEETWQVLGADAELKGKVKAVFTSEELPGNLVVVFGGATDAGKLKSALKEMPKEVLSNLRVAAFGDVDEARLQKARERFRGK